MLSAVNSEASDVEEQSDGTCEEAADEDGGDEESVKESERAWEL